MPETRVSLGKASFLQPRARTLVEVECSVNVATEVPILTAHTIHSPFSLDPDLFLTTKSIFEVQVCTDFADDLYIPLHQRRAFLVHIGRVLEEAEVTGVFVDGESTDIFQLWSQLRLIVDVSLSDEDRNCHSSKPAILSLRLRPHSPSSPFEPEQVALASTLPDDISNIQPPAGIPTAKISVIHISLAFASFQASVLAPQKRPRSDSSDFSGFLKHRPRQETGILREQICEIQAATVAEHWPSLQTERSPCSPCNIDGDSATILTSPKFSSSEDVLADLFTSSFDDANLDFEDIIYSSQDSSLSWTGDTPRQDTVKPQQTLEIQPLLSLVDAGFRSLICQNPIRMARGIGERNTSIDTRLADLVPSTFIPGYAEAITGRAALIPIAARFLTSFVHRSRRPSISALKEGLFGRFDGLSLAHSVEQGSIDDEDGKLKEVVKADLWMTMAIGLRNSELARRLKPLHVPSKTTVHLPEETPSKTAVDEYRESHSSFAGDFLSEELAGWSGMTLYEADDDDGELLCLEEEDGDEEAEEMNDLFEAYEARLRGDKHYCFAGVPVREAHYDEEWLDQTSTPSEQAQKLNTSPMLETPRLLPCSDPPDPSGEDCARGTTDDLDPVQKHVAPAAMQMTSSDRTGTNLLDEELPSSNEVSEDIERFLEPAPLPGNEYEQPFEQWEFDLEQGQDYMLF
jgi:hypothetical protein